MMYLVLAVMALRAPLNRMHTTQWKWLSVGVILTFIIGFRHHVGGDWYNYLRRFNDMEFLTLAEALSIKDPGYQWISYLMSDWGFQIYAVNFICAVIFVTGLIVFSRRQINPWLAVAVAVPYLIIVVSMGYTRQGVALGLVMWGLAALDRGQFVRFLVFVALATAFHKSAILMIGFGIFQQGKGTWVKVLALLFAAMGMWSAFVEDAADDLWKNYVDAEMESQGAMIRVLLNFIPSVLLLYFRKRWKQHFNDYGLWFMVAIASIASVVLVGSASTAVDRMALYFIPIQMVVYSRLPLLARNIIPPKTTMILILSFYALVLLVWLTKAVNARYWVPYDNLLFPSF